MTRYQLVVNVYGVCSFVDLLKSFDSLPNHPLSHRDNQSFFLPDGALGCFGLLGVLSAFVIFKAHALVCVMQVDLVCSWGLLLVSGSPLTRSRGFLI
jgi:hypothetical protein